ncbi:MAG: glycosyltransferase family 87 protein [Pseudomonadota bacterium]
MVLDGTQSVAPRKGAVLALAVFALCAALIWLVAGHKPSPDLYATWLAGEFFAQGALDAIYPADTDVFRMLPPEAWVALETSRGYSGDLYPFIYPPLWAALSSLLQGHATFTQVVSAATVINASLLSAMIVLAWRAAGQRIPLLAWAAISMLAIVVTPIGLVAINQNQPQILVSFLIVLTIERHRSGHPGWAGAVLALAAAIKIYPALFAIFYLATRDWAALRGFTVAGALLGGASISLAGWPLHVLFLEQLATISNTILITPLTFTFGTAIGQFIDRDTLEFVISARIITDGSPEGGWWVIAKGPVLSALCTVATLAILAVCACLYAQAAPEMRAACIWPLALGAVALISPISWVYHYLPVFAFLPHLLHLLGNRAGSLLLMGGLFPITLFTFPFLKEIPLIPAPSQFVGTLCVTALIAGFGVAATRRGVPSTAPRPASA